MIPRRVAWAVALCATLTMTVSYIDRSTLAMLGPTIKPALHMSNAAFGLVTQSAFSLAYLVGTPLAGWWLDRIGARRGLVVSLLVWTMVSGMQALAPGFATLFALRLALGLAESPSFPGAAQTVQRVIVAGDRSRAFGILFTGSSIGSMIAPPLASALFVVGKAHYGVDGWRFALLTSACVGFAWLPLWFMVTRMRSVKAVLDVPREARPRGALRELLVLPAMWRAWAAIIAVAPLVGFGITYGATYLDRTFRVPQESVGHYLWLPPLVFDATAILFGDLASRLPRAPGTPPRLLFAIGTVLALAIAALPLVVTPWQGVIVIAVAMGGNGVVYVLTTADLMSRIPAQHAGTAAGTIAAAQSLALIISMPLAGVAIDHFHSYDVAALALAAWVVPGCVTWLAWRAR